MEGINKFWQNVTDRAKGLVPMQVFPAVVKKVDEKLRTCQVRVNDNVDFVDVRLYAVVDDSLKGLCLIPSVDSTVLVGRIANSNELFVCSFSVVDKVLGTIGDKVEFAADKESLHYKVDKTDMTVKSNDIQVKTEEVTFTVSKNNVTVDANEIKFNGGKNAGLAKVAEIQKNLDSLKNYVEVMNTAISSGLGSVGESTGASGKAGSAEYKKEMTGQSITFSDMENTAVKH